jgi:hypothetical protein
MEWLTIILSSLFTLLSPVGLVADQVAEGLIRERIYQADLIDVRIDNAPNFQIAGGRLGRVRLAGRGVYPVPELRIDTIDVETDPIDVDLGALQSGKVALDEPLQVATRLVLKTEDLNVLLQSDLVQSLLNELQFNLPGTSDREKNRYGLSNPKVEFLEGNRLRVTVDLQDRVQDEEVTEIVESGFEVIDGHRLALVDPSVVIDGIPIPRQLLDAFMTGIADELTLTQLEEVGVTARILQFELNPAALDLVVFVRVEEDAALLAALNQE